MAGCDEGRKCSVSKAVSGTIHWNFLRYHDEQGLVVEVEPLDSSGRR